MKLAVLFGFFFLTTFVQAQTCKMELQSPYGDRIVDLRTANDPYCSKAYQACRNWYDWYKAEPGSACVRVEDDGRAAIDYILYPDYDSYFGPQTRNVPTRQTQVAEPSDAMREIERGETVFYNGVLHLVVSISENGFYNIKLPKNDAEIIKDITRPNMAVTRGCHAKICTTDSVIMIGSSSYVAVAGIEYDGHYVIKSTDGSEAITVGVNQSSLALTKGCTQTSSRKICVGAIVMRGRNAVYYTVAGIQPDGRAVIDSNGILTTNVRPEELLVVR